MEQLFLKDKHVLAVLRNNKAHVQVNYYPVEEKSNAKTYAIFLMKMKFNFCM